MEQRKQGGGSMSWWYLVALLAALAVCGVGIFLLVRQQNVGWALVAAGAVAIVAVLVTWPLSRALAAGQQAMLVRQEELVHMLTDRLSKLWDVINLISENQLLSDRAKAVAYRDKDRDALRRAIQEDIAKQDWEAALALVADMESTFGYRQEADRYREEINGQRRQVINRQINEAMVVIDRHTRNEQWSQALREAERLMGLFPGEEQVQNLPREIEERRQAHKQQLLASWQDAVNRKDVDGSIEILKKLDVYLTPAEAQALEESARGIFKEKLTKLRTEFASAVQEHRWAEAVRIGETIIRDFPNARVAQEVREKMETLRQRAGAPAPPAEAVA